MSVDPQVAALRKIPEPESLHDVLLRRFDVEGRNVGNPFSARLMICGKKTGDKAVGPVLESLATSASQMADSENPLLSLKGELLSVRSVLIDYGSEFIQILEGPDRHVYGFMSALRELTGVVSDVHVLFFEDDAVHCLPSGWIIIDNIPPACLGGMPPEKSDEEVGDSVIHDFANLRELAVTAGEADKARRTFFVENAKINHSKLFPKSCVVDMYVDSELFLTLKEFVDNFCGFPSGCRECEVTHPMEDPLKY